MADRIQIRRDTAANWTSVNPALAQGELGVETDTLQFKVGDGSTAWNSLSYLITATSGNAVSTTGIQTLTNKTISQSLLSGDVKEKTTVSATAATGTINFDVVTQQVLFYTANATANFTVNIRGDSSTTLNSLMAVGDSITVAFLVTNGGTAYYNNAVQVDGASVTPKWQGGAAPTAGNASSIDAYSYVVIKTGSAQFTVLASQTQFA